MTFGELPLRVLLPTTLPVAFVLVVVCYGVWVALHPKEKPYEETPLPALESVQISSLDSKGPSTVDVMV
jgi:hypothetical protein